MLCVLQSMEPDREVYYMKKKDMKNDEEFSLQIAKLKKESKHIEGNSFLMI